MISGLLKRISARRKEKELARAEEDELKRLAEAEQERFRNFRHEMYQKALQLERFPGNLEEYCALKGQRYEIIDTGLPDKTIVVLTSLEDYAFSRYYEPEREEEYSNNINWALSTECTGFIHCKNYRAESVRDRFGGYEYWTETRGVPVRRLETPEGGGGI